MTLTHQEGPVGGVSGPSAQPLAVEKPPLLFGGELPKFFFVTPVTNFQQQEDRNSCVAHGFSAPIESKARARGVILQVCRADIYSGALHRDGNEGRDVGVTIPSMARFVTEKGVLSEFERPYKTDDVTRRTNPALDARRAKGLTCVGLAEDPAAIKGAILVSGGVPYGHEVRSNYRPDANGILPLPSGSLNGYHCTELEGWHDDFGYLMRQSWVNWGIDHPMAGKDPAFKHLIGKRGFCWLPFAWTAKFFDATWIKGDVEVE